MAIVISSVQARNQLYAGYLMIADAKGNRNGKIDTIGEARIAASVCEAHESVVEYNHFAKFLTDEGFAVDSSAGMDSTPLADLVYFQKAVNCKASVNDDDVIIQSGPNGTTGKYPFVSTSPGIELYLKRSIENGLMAFSYSGQVEGGNRAGSFTITFFKGQKYLGVYNLKPSSDQYNPWYRANLKIPSGADYIAVFLVGTGKLNIILKYVDILER